MEIPHPSRNGSASEISPKKRPASDVEVRLQADRPRTERQKPPLANGLHLKLRTLGALPGGS